MTNPIAEFKENGAVVTEWDSFKFSATGQKLLAALQYFVIKSINPNAGSTGEVTIYEAGKAAGAASLFAFIGSLDAIAIHEERQKVETQRKLIEPRRLPSVQAQIDAQLKK